MIILSSVLWIMTSFSLSAGPEEETLATHWPFFLHVRFALKRDGKKFI